MIRVVDLAPCHLAVLDVQPQQRDAIAMLDEAAMEMLCVPGSYTVLEGDRPIICGGVMEIVPWRGLAWSFVAGNLQHMFVHAHRVAKRIIDVAPFPRIEFEVDCDFDEGHRWAQLLGFKLETPRMEKYGFDGRAVARYVRIR